MPDSKVKQINDAIKKNNLQPSSPDSKLPVRPSCGDQGRKIEVWANYMQLTPGADKIIHRYKVEFFKDSKTGKDPSTKMK
jgi:hypothetical protein